jgi:hypothetical protein
MAKDVERRPDARVTRTTQATGTVQPYQGNDPGDLLPHVPNSQTYNRPDWTELRPPANSRPQELWSKLIMPYRASLLTRLWLTYAWWRPLILLLILATIALLLWIVISPS